MGTNSETNIGNALFTNTQQRVLGLLYGHAGQSYYTNEIVRLTNAGSGAVHRELKKLTAAGLLSETTLGNQRRYQANPDNPVFEELRGLITKTFGIADHLRQALQPLVPRLDLALIYGSVARRQEGPQSDVDLLIIADSLDYGEIFSALSQVEAIIGRPVNPSLYRPADWQNRLQEQNSFVAQILTQPKIFLIGTENELQQSP